MFFSCFIRYLSIWITLQRQYIQSRGISRFCKLQSCQDFTFGVKLLIVLLLSKPWKPLWNTSALELFCQRESPKKHGKDLKKKSKWNPGSSDHCGRNSHLRRKFLNPALAAVPEVAQVQFVLLPQEALVAKTFIFCTGWTKGNFFDDKRVLFPSSPSDKRLKLLSMHRWFGFPFNPMLTLYYSPADSGEKSSEHNTQGVGSWANRLGRSHGLEPGGFCLTDELPVVHTSMFGTDMAIDSKFHLDLVPTV